MGTEQVAAAQPLLIGVLLLWSSYGKFKNPQQADRTALPRLAGDQPQQVQRAGIFRVLRQNFAIDRLRLGQMAGAMQFHGLRKITHSRSLSRRQRSDHCMPTTHLPRHFLKAIIEE